MTLFIFWAAFFGLLYVGNLIWGFPGIIYMAIVFFGALIIYCEIRDIVINIQQAAQNEKERHVRDQEFKKQQKQAETQRLLRECAFEEACRTGVDVCEKCRTIKPKRCKCGKCIERGCEGYDYWAGPGECGKCYQKRKQKEFEDAVAVGLDVCYGCSTIEPDRCEEEGHCLVCAGTCSTCGCCLRCNTSAGSECTVCD